jgi:membrane carboxypeptidase/penicillin-binding protein
MRRVVSYDEVPPIAVRIGFDDNSAMGGKETGSRATLPIFREIMLRVYKDNLVGPVPQFPRKIEDGIDAYLALHTSLQAEGDPPPRTPVLADAYDEKR